MVDEKKIDLNEFVKAITLVLKQLDLDVVPKKRLVDYYLYEYKSYEQYRDSQIYYNKKKIDWVWADEETLKRVAKIVEVSQKSVENQTYKIQGVCHGSRNGFEQSFLSKIIPNSNIIGTDISDTAKNFENSIQWDFHDENPEWLRKFDFVYSNSLDQSWKPKHALCTWLNQIKSGGIVIIEHTRYHGPEHVGEGDPFGVRPVVMPYILTEWFGHKINISHSVEKKSNMVSSDLDAWLFVLRKNTDEIVY